MTVEYLDEKTKLEIIRLNKTANKIKLMFYIFLGIDIVLILGIINRVWVCFIS